MRKLTKVIGTVLALALPALPPSARAWYTSCCHYEYQQPCCQYQQLPQQPVIQSVPRSDYYTLHYVPTVHYVPTMHYVPMTHYIPKVHFVPVVHYVPSVHYVPTVHYVPHYSFIRRYVHHYYVPAALDYAPSVPRYEPAAPPCHC